MNIDDKQIKLLASALYEIRQLLSSALGSESVADQSVREAAHLSYALHNESESVINGSGFDYEMAIKKINSIDSIIGGEFSSYFINKIKD